MTKIYLNGSLVDLSEADETKRLAAATTHNNAAPARALAKLRLKRNGLLDETDFWGASDMTMSDDMKTYRQALRDLPSGKDTVEKCKNAVFPTKP
tara:strand:- start:338 stop:622 length:285 start_codon:yes stop_codon:yes gene_type:complete